MIVVRSRSSASSESLGELKTAVSTMVTIASAIPTVPEATYAMGVGRAFLSFFTPIVAEGEGVDAALLQPSSRLSARFVEQAILRVHRVSQGLQILMVAAPVPQREESNSEADRYSPGALPVWAELDALIDDLRQDEVMFSLEGKGAGNDDVATIGYTTRELDEIRRRFSALVSELSTAHSRYVVESGAQQTQEMVDDVAEAVSTKGGSKLATHFEDFAEKELHSSYLWFLMALAIGALLTWAAYEHVGSVQGLSWIDLARRSAVAVPAAAVLIYAQRQATMHRMESLLANHVAVQLRTVNAYTDGLSPDDRSRLRLRFGEAVFTGAPNAARASTDQADAALVRTVAEAVRSALGNNKP